MTTNTKLIISFVLGAAVGGAGTWFGVRTVYAKRSEADILSVKEAFRERIENMKVGLDELKDGIDKLAGTSEETDISEPTVLTTEKIQDKENVLDYIRGRKYTQYSRKIPAGENSESNSEETDILKPYVIPPEDYGEFDDYGKVSLYYFADKIVADEQAVVLDNVDEILGDALEHFGEYEDDSVYCRSDLRRCDYAILKNLDTYAEYKRRLPPNL